MRGGRRATFLTAKQAALRELLSGTSVGSHAPRGGLGNLDKHSRLTSRGTSTESHVPFNAVPADIFEGNNKHAWMDLRCGYCYLCQEPLGSTMGVHVGDRDHTNLQYFLYLYASYPRGETSLMTPSAFCPSSQPPSIAQGSKGRGGAHSSSLFSSSSSKMAGRESSSSLSCDSDLSRYTATGTNNNINSSGTSCHEEDALMSVDPVAAEAGDGRRAKKMKGGEEVEEEDAAGTASEPTRHSTLHCSKRATTNNSEGSGVGAGDDLRLPQKARISMSSNSFSSTRSGGVSSSHLEEGGVGEWGKGKGGKISLSSSTIGGKGSFPFSSSSLSSSLVSAARRGGVGGGGGSPRSRAQQKDEPLIQTLRRPYHDGPRWDSTAVCRSVFQLCPSLYYYATTHIELDHLHTVDDALRRAELEALLRHLQHPPHAALTHSIQGQSPLGFWYSGERMWKAHITKIITQMFPPLSAGMMTNFTQKCWGRSNGERMYDALRLADMQRQYGWGPYEGKEKKSFFLRQIIWELLSVELRDEVNELAKHLVGLALKRLAFEMVFLQCMEYMHRIQDVYERLGCPTTEELLAMNVL